MARRLALAFLAAAAALILLFSALGGEAGAIGFTIVAGACPFALMALGAARRDRLGAAALPIALALVLIELSLAGMLALRGRVLDGPWIGGLPLAAALADLRRLPAAAGGDRSGLRPDLRALRRRRGGSRAAAAAGPEGARLALADPRPAGDPVDRGRLSGGGDRRSACGRCGRTRSAQGLLHRRPVDRPAGHRPGDDVGGLQRLRLHRRPGPGLPAGAGVAVHLHPGELHRRAALLGGGQAAAPAGRGRGRSTRSPTPCWRAIAAGRCRGWRRWRCCWGRSPTWGRSCRRWGW